MLKGKAVGERSMRSGKKEEEKEEEEEGKMNKWKGRRKGEKRRDLVIEERKRGLKEEVMLEIKREKGKKNEETGGEGEQK